VLRLQSVAHTAVCSAVMAVYGNTLQMGPICVIDTALLVIHVFSHCATSTGGVVVSTQCIQGQKSEDVRVQCYQEWMVEYIIGASLQSVAHHSTVQHHAFHQCAGLISHLQQYHTHNDFTQPRAYYSALARVYRFISGAALQHKSSEIAFQHKRKVAWSCAHYPKLLE
jgi:hypothetical protein